MSFLKRLFGSDHSLFGEVASGDWAPVPAYATAQTANVADWLQEAPPPRPRREKRRSKEEQAVMRHLSPEERRIVSEQRSQRKRRNTFSRIVARLSQLHSQSEPCGPELQQPVEQAPQRASSKNEWVDVLKKYGEHLTDDELAIIRGQLK
jgi:hypothetical protein